MKCADSVSGGSPGIVIHKDDGSCLITGSESDADDGQVAGAGSSASHEKL